MLEMLIPAIPAIPHWQVLWSFSNLGGVPGKDSPSLSEALVALWLQMLAPGVPWHGRNSGLFECHGAMVVTKLSGHQGFERPYSVRITLLCTGFLYYSDSFVDISAWSTKLFKLYESYES